MPLVLKHVKSLRSSLCKVKSSSFSLLMSSYCEKALCSVCVVLCAYMQVLHPQTTCIFCASAGLEYVLEL